MYDQVTLSEGRKMGKMVPLADLTHALQFGRIVVPRCATIAASDDQGGLV